MNKTGLKNKDQQLFRVKLIFLLILFGFAIIIIRLFFVQVIGHNKYKTLANNEQTNKFTIPAQRGEILTRDSVGLSKLVLNEPVFTLYVDPKYVINQQKTTDAILKVVDIDRKKLDEILSKDSQYEVVAKGLSLDQKRRIDKQNIRGVGLTKTTRRVYSEGNLAAQVLGFVDNQGVGQYGVEQSLNKVLSGKDGLLNGVTDVRGVPIATEDTTVRQPVNGSNVVLTIDRAIQRKAEQALSNGVKRTNADSGSVVVMDPNNGKILAMANYPTFSPSEYAKQTDISVFTNKTVTFAYEAGSVLKAFPMLTGLNEGVVSPDTTYNDRSCEKISGYDVCNVGPKINKTRNMTEVITRSANTGVIFVLRKLGGGNAINIAGKTKLYDYYTKKFGFGQLTGIEQPGESGGFIRTPAKSSDVGYANMTFGQGISTTMVQLAAALSAAINGGTYYQPTLIDSIIDENGTEVVNNPKVIRKNIVKVESSRQIREMMQTVVESGSGQVAKVPGYKIGAKTGTAEIANPNGGYYKDRFTGSFMGFTSVDNPQYVIITRVDNPKISGYAGPEAAGPIFAEINSWLIRYKVVKPGV
jgi:cell division protein FtsI/penicillin-binding protein 2